MLSDTGTQEAVENSDLIIHVGPLPSDSNTGGWSASIPLDRTIVLHPSYCCLKGKRIEKLHFAPLFRRIVKNIPELTAIREPALINPKVSQLNQLEMVVYDLDCYTSPRIQ